MSILNKVLMRLDSFFQSSLTAFNGFGIRSGISKTIYSWEYVGLVALNESVVYDSKIHVKGESIYQTHGVYVMLINSIVC